MQRRSKVVQAAKKQHRTSGVGVLVSFRRSVLCYVVFRGTRRQARLAPEDRASDRNGGRGGAAMRHARSALVSEAVVVSGMAL